LNIEIIVFHNQGSLQPGIVKHRFGKPSVCFKPEKVHRVNFGLNRGFVTAECLLYSIVRYNRIFTITDCSLQSSLSIKFNKEKQTRNQY